MTIGAFGQLDRINAQKKSRCIGLVSKYRDLWTSEATAPREIV